MPPRHKEDAPYAAGRVVHDADSHSMESEDWLASYADAGVRDRLIGMRLEAGGSGAAKPIKDPQERQKDAAKTAEIASNVVTGPKGWAYGRDEPRRAPRSARRSRLSPAARVYDHLRAKDFFSLSFAPQNFLCALALDGVFERHPHLRGGVIELGAGWRPISSGGSTARGRAGADRSSRRRAIDAA